MASPFVKNRGRGHIVCFQWHQYLFIYPASSLVPTTKLYIKHIIGLISALQMHRLRVKGDSKLIIQQVNTEFLLKEIALVSYRTAIQNLIKSFFHIQFHYMPRAHNKHANSLAPSLLRLMLLMRQLMWELSQKFASRRGGLERLPTSIIQNLVQRLSVVVAVDLKDSIVIYGKLYPQGSDGVLAQTLSLTGPKEQLQHVRGLACKETN